MRRFQRRASTLAALCAPLAGAQTILPGSTPRKPLVETRVLADVDRIGPGQSFQLAVIFDVEPGWHIYWKNPGAGALAPTLDVDAPPGFEIGAVRWPRPIVIDSPVGASYCYEDRAVLFVPVTAPATLTAGEANLSVDAQWAVCRNVCKVGSARHALVLPAAGKPVPPPERLDAVLRDHRRRLPQPLASLDGASISFDGSTLKIIVPARGRRVATFFPDPTPGVRAGEPSVKLDGDRFVLTVPVAVEPENALGEPMALAGLVALGGAPDDPCYDFQLSLDRP